MNYLRIAILGLLQREGLYGYQIRRALQSSPFSDWAGFPNVSPYPELNRLAAEGLVEELNAQAAAGRPSRTLYRLSPAGLETLRHALREAWRELGAKRLPQDLALFFLDALPRDELINALHERLSRLEEEARRLQDEREWTRTLLDRVRAASGMQLPQPQPAPEPFVRRRPRRATKGQGAFTFVLHSHLPYCRMAGRWPHGEEWIHEAMAETYVPLLNVLYDLREEGVDYRLTLSLTPVLAEQLADADISRHFLHYLDSEILAAECDIPRFGEVDNAHLEYLARFYRDYYLRIKDSYLNRFGGDLIAAFRRLQDEGYLEIVTCAATHGYLPLLARDSSIYAQLRTGVESYKRLFGRSPRAVWLPECAYRPAYVDADGTVRPALEEFLAALGLTCFFVETHAIEGGRPVGKAAGETAIGPYGLITRAYVIPTSAEAGPGGTTFQAYYVMGSDRGLTDPPVAVIGRNNRTGQQVWSADLGYPGDADYREFHKKDDVSGLQYWRVTGPKVDLGAKDYYHPDWAEGKVYAHAQHFVELVEQLLSEYHAQSGKYGLISANYDTELFGHWWFEGVNWIKEVLRRLAASEVVDLTTASAYVAENPPEQVIVVPESSWGVGGAHWTWDNPETHWMWPLIHEAERRMEGLVERYPQAEGDALIALNQAARELLLLESSDWPFLVTTGQAKQYATERFRNHLARFQQLADLLEAGTTAEARGRAEELYELDKLFPDVDYRWFRERQGSAC